MQRLLLLLDIGHWPYKYVYCILHTSTSTHQSKCNTNEWIAQLTIRWFGVNCLFIAYPIQYIMCMYTMIIRIIIMMITVTELWVLIKLVGGRWAFRMFCCISIYICARIKIQQNHHYRIARDKQIHYITYTDAVYGVSFHTNFDMHWNCGEIDWLMHVCVYDVRGWGVFSVI